jgi:hypothetical protein
MTNESPRSWLITGTDAAGDRVTLLRHRTTAEEAGQLGALEGLHLLHVHHFLLSGAVERRADDWPHLKKISTDHATRLAAGRPGSLMPADVGELVQRAPLGAKFDLIKSVVGRSCEIILADKSRLEIAASDLNLAIQGASFARTWPLFQFIEPWPADPEQRMLARAGVLRSMMELLAHCGSLGEVADAIRIVPADLHEIGQALIDATQKDLPGK